MLFDALLHETISFRSSNNVLINKGKDREKQDKDCGRNEVSNNREDVRGKQGKEAVTKGELG